MSSDMPPPPPPPSYGGPSGYPPPPGAYPGAGYPGGGYPPAAPYGYQAPGAQYAGFGARLGAYLLDALISALFVAPAIVALLAGPKGGIRRCTINDEPRLCRYPSGGTIAVAVILGVIGIVAFLYFYCKLVGTTGQSWGMKAANVRVVDQRSGAPIGVGRAVGRYFGRLISAVPCYLGFLWMLWDANKQTWHDKFVQSVVVKT
jgi:uncharacterized RDD family membrane protein YckC